MSTYIDSRTSSTPNTNSFLYQNHPPSSPVASNTHLGQQQHSEHHHHHHHPQQQSQQQQQQQQQPPQQQQTIDDKPNEVHYSNDHGMLVDYLVSPKPSPSRALQPNLSDEMSSNNDITKRRSSSSSSSASSIALKPIKLATDISNSKEHVLKRDPFQLKSNSNASGNANNAAAAAAATAPTSLAMSTKSAKHYEKKKSSRLYKREKLKEAKSEYEEHIEEYFHQLTVGCQQMDCRNKFCASGRGKLYIKGNLSLL